MGSRATIAAIVLAATASAQTQHVEPEQPLPSRIVLVVDVSGSMGPHVAEAVRFVANTLRQPCDALDVAVVAFSVESTAHDYVSLPDADAQAEVVSWLEAFGSGGGTLFSPALGRAAKLEPEAIVLVSDGVRQPCLVGGRQRVSETREQVVAAAGSAGVPVWTYVVGSSKAGRALLEDVARATGGGCYSP